jgi:hypothetical protein
MTLEVTITSSEYAMKQAMMTTHDYMLGAVADIDQVFGKDYARTHPELVAAYMRTAAQDFHTTIMKAAAQDIRDEITALPFDDLTAAVKLLANAVAATTERAEQSYPGDNIAEAIHALAGKVFNVAEMLDLRG